jgi:ubiquinone biosynthesis accessory factor UbiJ
MDIPADTISAVLANAANQIADRALASDPELRKHLTKLSGQCIELRCLRPPASWHLIIDDDRLVTVAGPAAAPQAMISANAADLLAWLLPGDLPKSVEISGDTALLMEFAAMLRDFSPDIATPLSQFVGPEAAATLLGTAEVGLHSLRSLLADVGQNIQQQARAGFVQSKQMDSFLRDIDKLRLRVDRLAAKIDQQEQIRRRSDH